LPVHSLQRAEVVDHALGTFEHFPQPRRRQIQRRLLHGTVGGRQRKPRYPRRGQRSLIHWLGLHQQLVRGRGAYNVILIGSNDFDLQTAVQSGQERKFRDPVSWIQWRRGWLEIPPSRRAIQPPAVGKSDGRFEPQRANVGHARSRTEQLDGMPAFADPKRTLRFPLGRAGLPTAGDRGEAGMHALAVQMDFDGPRIMGRIQRDQRVLGGDGNLDVVFGLVGQHAGVPDAGVAVRVGLPRQADSHIAAIEPIRTNRQTGNGRFGGQRA